MLLLSQAFLRCGATADDLEARGLSKAKVCFLLTSNTRLRLGAALLLGSFVLMSKLKEQPLSGTCGLSLRENNDEETERWQQTSRAGHVSPLLSVHWPTEWPTLTEAVGRALFSQRGTRVSVRQKGTKNALWTDDSVYQERPRSRCFLFLFLSAASCLSWLPDGCSAFQPFIQRVSKRRNVCVS